MQARATAASPATRQASSSDSIFCTPITSAAAAISANASYAVSASDRGRGVGRQLIRDCIDQAARLGFRILQFNAVVATNTPARRLYESLGFQQLGVIPGGFRLSDGSYADICPYYLPLPCSQ